MKRWFQYIYDDAKCYVALIALAALTKLYLTISLTMSQALDTLNASIAKVAQTVTEKDATIAQLQGDATAKDAQIADLTTQVADAKRAAADGATAQDLAASTATLDAIK